MADEVAQTKCPVEAPDENLGVNQPALSELDVVFRPGIREKHDDLNYEYDVSFFPFFPGTCLRVVSTS